MRTIEFNRLQRPNETRKKRGSLKIEVETNKGDKLETIVVCNLEKSLV